MTTMSHARLHDQFYTQRPLARRLTGLVIERLGDPAGFRWLEPSAGSGAFLDAMPSGTVGLDLDPHHPGVAQGDFLNWQPEASGDERPWIVVGNPPFGKNSSLAIKFFNQAATFARQIAFIVPRTFEKHSVQNRLNPGFHLAYEEVLPVDSFEFEGNAYGVPCVFQIWEKQDEARSRHQAPLTHLDFAYTTREEADFAFQRVGVRAGAVKDMPNDRLAAPSHHFIRVLDRSAVAQVRARLTAIDWDAVKHRTAGNPSISKAEIVKLYSDALALEQPVA